MRSNTAYKAQCNCNMGGVAQLGERLICIQEVIGSIPFTSTRRTASCSLEMLLVTV